MSKAKHTVGTWKVDGNDVITTAPDVEGNVICEAPVWAEESMKNWEANARLIAASPEMYDALRKVNNFISANMGKNYMVALLNREVPEIKELIKKIEG